MERHMRHFTTVELVRDLKTVTHAASRAPVAITQHRKARYVLMAIEDFERLTRGVEDPRRAFGPGETPAEIAEIFNRELDKLIEDAG
jgi:hypothetical protein